MLKDPLSLGIQVFLKKINFFLTFGERLYNYSNLNTESLAFDSILKIFGKSRLGGF